MLNVTIEKATAMQIKTEAKKAAMEAIQAGNWNDLGAEYVGPTPYIPVQVNGQEVWVEVKLTTKQWTDSKAFHAFDPFAAAEEYEENMRIKAQEAEAAKKAKEEAVRAKKSKNARRKTKVETAE